ncbi:MAG: HAMP domain-containing protein [Bdellovibrionota bacterium]
MTNTAPNLRKKRTRYVNDPSFQFRYGIWLSGIGVFCFFFMGFLAYISVYRELERELTFGIPREVLENVTRPQVMFLHYEILVPLFVLVIFLFCTGVVGTHKIAGPLFGIKRQLNQVKSGIFSGPILIRAGDQLQDLVNGLNDMLRAFEKQKSVHRDLCRKIDERLEAGDLPGATQLTKELKKSLNSAHLVHGSGP